MQKEYASSNKEKPKILIVDDIDMNVEILDNMLSAEGYDTLCALNVQEALGLIRNIKPSLILSDLSMPEIDGLEFCRMLKNNPKTRDIPFVFISVLNSGEEKERAFKAGAVDYIPKPFEAVEVIMRVRNQLSSYQMRQNMADYNRMMHAMVEEQKKELEQGQVNVLRAMAGILERRDAGMERHLRNVGHNCRVFAQALQFLPEYGDEITDEFIEGIETAAKLYDIGSLVIPGHSGSRSAESHERAAPYMEQRSREGIRILQEIGIEHQNGCLLTMAINIAKYQYAHWDGTGYPAVEGRAIPLEARITALVRDFDRLSAGADSETELSAEAIIQAMDEGSGVVYDPDMVEVFHKIQKQMNKGRI